MLASTDSDGEASSSSSSNYSSPLQGSSKSNVVDELDMLVDAMDGYQHFGIREHQRPHLPAELKMQFPTIEQLVDSYHNRLTTRLIKRHSIYGRNVCSFLQPVIEEKEQEEMVVDRNKNVQVIATVATRKDQAEAMEVEDLVRDLENEARELLQVLSKSVSKRNNDLILKNSTEANLFWALAQERKKEREAKRKHALEQSERASALSSSTGIAPFAFVPGDTAAVVASLNVREIHPPKATTRLTALPSLPNMEHILLDFDISGHGTAKTTVNFSGKQNSIVRGTDYRLKYFHFKLTSNQIDVLSRLFNKPAGDFMRGFHNSQSQGATSSKRAERPASSESDSAISGSENDMEEDNGRNISSKKSSSSSRDSKQEVFTCFIPLIHPYPKSQCWLSIPRNIRTEDQPVLRYVPYFGDDDTTGADLSNYENNEIEQELAYEAYEILIHFMFEKHQERRDTVLSVDGEKSVNVRPEVLSALENVLEISTRQCVKCFERYSEGLLANLKLKNSKNTDKTMESLLVMYCRRQMLDLHGYITPSYSNADIPNSFLGIVGQKDGVFDSITNSYSELFCRQCYKFMCGMHEYKGNYQHVKKNRHDSSHHISLTFNSNSNPAPNSSFVIPGIALPTTLLDSKARNPNLNRFVPPLYPASALPSTLSDKKRKLDSFTGVVVGEDFNLSRTSGLGDINDHKEISPTGDGSISTRSISPHEAMDFLSNSNSSSSGSSRSSSNSNSRDVSNNIDFMSLDFSTCMPCIPLYAPSERPWHDVERALVNKSIDIWGSKNTAVIANILGTRTQAEVDAYLSSTSKDSFEIDEAKLAKSANTKGQSSKLKSARHSAKEIYPCNHDGPCTMENCSCMQNENFCEKYCSCPKSCDRRFPGCKCRSTCRYRSCPCIAASRECDPDLCFHCGVSVHPVLQTTVNEAQTKFINSTPNFDANNSDPIIMCKNMSIRNNLGKRIYQGRSGIHGWGAYLLEKVEKNDFICEYRGEMISHEEAERRGRIYDKLDSSFLFDLNDDTCLDSTRKGNKAKFVNHSMDPNCYSKIIVVSGDHKIALFAKKPISVGEELCFNYTYKETCAPLWALTRKDDFLK